MTPGTVDVAFLRRLFVGTILVLAVLSLANLTTSSIGLHVAGDQPNSADVIFGEPRPIRSDEWNRGTPVVLGTFLDSWNSDALTPFEERDVRFGWIGETVLPSLVHPERALVGLLPARMGFFMFLWIPPIVAVSAVAALLRLAGVGRISSIAGGVATSLGAASAWWSYHGSQLVWPAALAASLLMLAWAARTGGSSHSARPKGQEIWAVVLAVLAGLLLTRYPLLYAPWAIPTVMIFGALIVDLWRSQPKRRRALKPLVVSGTVALLVAGLSVVSQSPRLSALAGTSYPAARRFVGGSEGMPVFTGAHMYYSQSDRGTVMNGSNLSESATGPVVLVLVALVLLWVARIAGRGRPDRFRLGTTASVVAVLLGWAITEWPSMFSGLNPLTIIPGLRVTQIIGVLAMPFVWIVISRVATESSITRRGWLAAGVGALVLVVSSIDGVVYREMFPLVTSNETWFSAVALAGATAYFVWQPARPKAAVPLAMFIFLSAAWVNPLVRGVGDLYDSSSATRLREVAVSGRVASDQIGLDALLIANAIPTLGGQLNWGPDEHAWAVLDPEGMRREAWNRGASSLQFAWNPSRLDIDISAPFPDVVMVDMHPCNPILNDFGVEWVMSSQPLETACLSETLQFTWGGLPRWLYSVIR